MFRFQLEREAVIDNNDRQDEMHHIYCYTSLQAGTNIEGLIALNLWQDLYLQYELTIFCNRLNPPLPLGRF